MQLNLQIGKGSFQPGHGKLTVCLCIREGAFHYTAVAEYGIQTFIPFLLNKRLCMERYYVTDILSMKE